MQAICSDRIVKRRFRRNLVAWTLGHLLLIALPLRAATPRDELLRLVPDDVGFCFVVQDLRAQAALLQSSPFVEKLSRSPMGLKIRAFDDLKKLDRFESKLKEALGLDWTQLRDDILGDALVMAYRPGPPGKPDQEQGIFLLRTRNEKVLADLIARVNKAQKDEGELKKLEELRHNGATYYRRLQYDKRTQSDKPAEYYFVHGPILALSTQENFLREAIDCERTRTSDFVPETLRRLRELDAERALFAVWINPRAFDAEVAAKVADAPEERGATVRHFALYWKALESVVVSMTPGEQDFHVSLGVRARVPELPSAARRFFQEASTTSETWRRFPESALLAIGGRLDGASLLEVLEGFLSPKNRQELHTTLNRQLGVVLGEEDVVRDLLPGLGPDWGLCVTAPPPDSKNGMPRTLFALRLDVGRAKKKLGNKLTGALDFAARFVILMHNNQNPEQAITLKTAVVNKQEVHYLSSERGLPDGVTPSYGLLDGYLVLSSSLDNLNQFAQTPPPLPPSSDTSTPLLRISLKDWRAYLSERRAAIVDFLAQQNKAGRETASRQLDDLLAGLQFLDRIELRQRVAPGQVIFTLSVRTTQALRKCNEP